MKFFLFTGLFLIMSIQNAYSQQSVYGKVLNATTQGPVEDAVVAIPEQGLWATTNEKGEFIISKVSHGNFTLVVSCLGFERYSKTFDNLTPFPVGTLILLNEDNLALNEVVVTARKKTEELTTTYVIDRNAMKHMQAISVNDLLSHLPGSQTRQTISLTSEQRLALRSQSNTELDNPTFGTAIEIDGVRLSNNGAFTTSSISGFEGVGTRNIALSNIESVEVVTGLPSVEHGDLTSGLLKINTRKGKSPYEVVVVSKPQIKSYSFGKGYQLGKKAGVLNTGFEHTKSISDRSSPYTTYVRNNFSLNYRNTFGKIASPIELTYGFTGNLGGYNSVSDPDAFKDTYTKISDNVLRSNLQLKWLLNRPWITELEFSTSGNYNNRSEEIKTNKSSSSAVASIHTLEEGYFIATDYDVDPKAPIYFIPAGYWYELMYNKEKPVSYSASIKATWLRKFGNVNSHFKTGTELIYTGNIGRGVYYHDNRYAPTFREFNYNEQPFVKNYAFYAEEKVSFLVWERVLDVQAGIRADAISIRGSEYGVAQSLSPRSNARYTLIDNKNTLVKKLSFYTGWGDAVKLPSANILFPRTEYSDRLSFASGTLADGTTFYAYQTNLYELAHNPNLKWQRNRKAEIGMDLSIGGNKITVTTYRDKTFNPYSYSYTYSPLSYKLTDQSALADSPIPYEARAFSIDRQSGIVTVHDKTGYHNSYELSYRTMDTFRSIKGYYNRSPVIKKGIEWVVDFEKISLLSTSVRVDGNYSYYKGVDETLIYHKASNTNMGDGNPYKYIGIYVGESSSSNGSITKRLTTNLTFLTHIPVIRMIASIRLEACFYDYAQNLSQYSGGNRSFVLDSKDGYFPSETSTDIYAGNQFVAMYPLYYISLDDMEQQIPFAEMFLWARDNDRALYNELAKMVLKTNYSYIFNASYYSTYFSGNISITKEIGEKLSVSFQANNFINNMAKVYSGQTDREFSLYSLSKIPTFNYCITMRLKL